MDLTKMLVMSENATVGDALDRMLDENIYGVAVPKRGHYGLIAYADLDAAMVLDQLPRKRTLAKYETFRFAPVIGGREAERLLLPTSLDLASIATDGPKIEQFLRYRGYAYAGFEQAGDYAPIFSISERSLEIFSAMPKDCFCSDRFERHYYDRDGHPETCDVDATIINCR